MIIVGFVGWSLVIFSFLLLLQGARGDFVVLFFGQGIIL